MNLNNNEEHVFLPNTPKMIQWVIKYSGGFVKNEKQAQFVLIGIMVLAIIISLILIFGSTNTSLDDQYYDESLYEEELPSN